MRYLRLVIPVAALVCLLSGSALARSEAAPKAPSNLKPFLLRADEAKKREFPRTPSFSWKPVRGAVRYEFQLAKSPGFSDGSVLWSRNSIKAPAVAVPIALPWMTGNPYAAYARVRAVTGNGVTPWSKAFGFNIRWTELPKHLPDLPGLSRWTPVEGATAYDVWFTRIGKSAWSKTVRTRASAVDHREAYAFHDDPEWTGDVRFRVRAVRIIYGEIPSGLPAVSYGPWSNVFTSRNAPQSGALRAVAAISNVAVSKPGIARAHEMTPAFSFKGRVETTPGAKQNAGLYRVYISTDRDCVNVVFRGPAVGSPGYAPRLSGTLALPKSDAEVEEAKAKVLADGEEGETYGADNLRFKSSEAPSEAGKGSGGSSGDSGSDDTGATPLVNGAKVDLWESGWPNGRFYWTVVPVRMTTKDDGTSIVYRDTATPQDQCQRGNVVAFGKRSAPVVAGKKAPFASGLSPAGRLVAGGKQARFYGSPIVAWKPAQGAEGYQIEWSKKRYPWRTAGKTKTFGTAAGLSLEPGTWWYRIRGMNPYLPGTAAAMGWSTPQKLVVTAPRFSVRSGR